MKVKTSIESNPGSFFTYSKTEKLPAENSWNRKNKFSSATTVVLSEGERNCQLSEDFKIVYAWQKNLTEKNSWYSEYYPTIS